MKTTLKYITTILAVLILSNCRGIYEDSTELASDYKASVNSISVADLNAKIEKGESFNLLDVRQPDDFNTDNIPGSVSMPRGDVEFHISDSTFWSSQYMFPPEKSDVIIVYSGDGNLGILSAVTLKQLGYKNVFNLDGGYKAYNPNKDPNAKPKTSGGCGG